MTETNLQGYFKLVCKRTYVETDSRTNQQISHGSGSELGTIIEQEEWNLPTTLVEKCNEALRADIKSMLVCLSENKFPIFKENKMYSLKNFTNYKEEKHVYKAIQPTKTTLSVTGEKVVGWVDGYEDDMDENWIAWYGTPYAQPVRLDKKEKCFTIECNFKLIRKNKEKENEEIG